MSTHDYKVGSIIEYGAFGGLARRVRVEEKESNIKNGRPGFTGVMVDANNAVIEDEDGIAGVWGYDEQITRVVTR
jgi:hypothetical protein